MAYNYIRRIYGVCFRPGRRISVDGREGTVMRAKRGTDPQYVRVRFDGEKHPVECHPTWNVAVLKEPSIAGIQVPTEIQ